MHAKKSNKKSSYFFVIFASLVMFIFPVHCHAQQPLKDVSVSVILPLSVNASNYTKFIRITNNDDVTGINDDLSVFVIMVLYDNNGSLEFEWNVTKSINSYSESGFGTLSVGNGIYNFCADVFAVNFEDYNLSNNRICKNISSLLYENFSDVLENSSFISENITGNQSGVVENNSFVNSSECNSTIYNDSWIINITVNITIDNLSSNISYILIESTTIDSNDSLPENNSPELNQTPRNESINEYINYNNTEGYNETNITNIANATNEEFACICSLNIKTSKDLFLEGEKIEFHILDCWNSSKYIHPVEYWIEDIEGIVKPIINTTSRAPKSYTPSINIDEKYFLIKSRIQGCPNISQKLVVFTREIKEDESSEISHETFLELSDMSYSSSSSMAYVRVSGYKGESSKTLVSVWIERNGEKSSDVTKFYVNGENAFFDFKVPVFVNADKQGAYVVVADGLGEREESKILISLSENKQNENNQDEDIKENQKEEAISFVEENHSAQGKITSFYTLKKYLDENITIYISVENPSEKELRVFWENRTLFLKNISGKNAVNISSEIANATVFAELYFYDVLIDSSELRLNLTPRNEIENKKVKSEESKMHAIAELSYDSLDIKNVQEVNKNVSNEITGEIVSVRHSGKGIAFAFVTTIVCFMLFSRKARMFLLQKTKLLSLRAFFIKKTK